MSIKKNMLTTQEAARELGVTDARIRQMIIEGACKAEKYEGEIFPAGYIWLVPQQEINRIREKRNPE
jgi:excisionase family DNA binding protein